MTNPDITPPLTRVDIICRGILARCPKCGQGNIFQSYLKLKPACQVCGEDFSYIRADDGPAWLTIMIVGHLAVPLAIYLAMEAVMPSWAALTLLIVLTISMALLILPRAKGVFIGMLWWLRQNRHTVVSKYDAIEKVP